MSIILRTNKGQALSYDEMDRNQSQFFYSSSLHNSNTKLRLHYTGSDNLDTATEDYGPNRYQEITFPSLSQTQPAAAAAGSNTQVQFNDSGTFGADALFTFDKVSNYLGIGTGTPSDRLDIHGDGVKGATVSLRGQSGGTGTLRHANINFLEGSTYLGRIGRAASTTEDLYFINNKEVGTGFGKVHIGAGTGDATTDNADNIVAATFTRTSTGISRVGIGTKIPNRQISLVGDEGIGISTTGDNTLQSFLAPIPSGIFSSTNDGGQKDLIPNGSTEIGLLISSPVGNNGGNVVVAINADNTPGQINEGFNIINANGGSYATSEVIFSAQANKKVGINTNFPSDVGLTVDGIISGSGNGQIDGTLTVGTIAAVTGTGTNKTIVTDSNGLLNYLPAAPVPFGGIIMWSGNTNAVPEGWVLCNLNSSVTTGLGTRFVPDLTNKFVIGWNGDEAASGPKTDITGADTVQGGSKDAIVVAHTHPITDQGHRHIIDHRVDSTTAGNFLTLQGTPNSDEGSWSGNGLDNGNLRSRSATTNISVNSTGSSGTNKNLPPYYALAFIMYVGV